MRLSLGFVKKPLHKKRTQWVRFSFVQNHKLRSDDVESLG